MGQTTLIHDNDNNYKTTTTLALTASIQDNLDTRRRRPLRHAPRRLRSRDVHGNGIPNGTGNPMGIPWEWE